jgi:hypothetical protein
MEPLSSTIRTKGGQTMADEKADPAAELNRASLQQEARPFASVSSATGLHHSKLPAEDIGSPIASEWEVYRREVGRLLGEGHEGKWVLIKGKEVIGIFDSWDHAREEGVKRFLLQPMLVKQVLTWEPILNVRGYNRP